jgi:multiple sugar transport system ATP-binding protein
MTIELKDVQKQYSSGFHAVKNLSLRIEDGEFFTLLGPSGCGKTTTLRMIAGLESVSSGSVQIGDKNFTHTHPRDRNVAMVFQSYALYPHMTVRQNLTLNLQAKKTNPDEIERRLADVSQMLGLGELIDRKPAQLSGGQRQRVALGRALIRRPNVFLMDEPLSNLDLKLRERTQLKKLHEQLLVTTVYVTHDQAEALVLSDRIGVMNGGDLLQVATPQDIYDRPRNMFVAKFVGTPSINFVEVTVTLADGKLGIALRESERAIPGSALMAEQELLATLPQGPSRFILGVRPEAIAISRDRDTEGLDAIVELIEPMGSVNHILVRLDGYPRVTVSGEPLVAVARSNEEFVQGSRIKLSLRPDRLVLFAPHNEESWAVLSSERNWRRP